MRLSVLILTVAATFTHIVHSNEIDNCSDIYKKCNKQSLDGIWQPWEAGPKTNKAEDVDKFFYSSYEAHYKLLSCNELENACMQDRPAGLDRYAFVKDNNLELNWVSTSAESKNVNQNKLDRAISSAKALPRMQSFLVAKENELIVEEYFHRKGDYRPQHVQSVTKSITSLLIGIAIDQGYIKSEDESIKDYFPEYFSKPHDKRKADITIKQLLAMQ